MKPFSLVALYYMFTQSSKLECFERKSGVGCIWDETKKISYVKQNKYIRKILLKKNFKRFYIFFIILIFCVLPGVHLLVHLGCWYIYLSFIPFLYLSVKLFNICISMYVSIYLNYLGGCCIRSIYLSSPPSICLSVIQYIYLCVYLS